MTELINNDYYVYMHKNKINNKIYIGRTKQTKTNRWGTNGNGYRDQADFWQAINDFGWDNFEHIILAENLTQDEANKLERELIAKYNTTDLDYGYNGNSGGEKGLQWSDAARERMSESAKQRCDEEWRIQNSQLQSGSKRPQCSNPCSDEVKEIFRKRNSKAVYQKTLGGMIIRKFNSQSEAERITGVPQASIWRCCNNQVKSAGGYDWDYVDSCNEPHENRMQIVVQLDFDGNYIREWACAAYAEDELGIVRGKVTVCCKGYRRSTGGFKWMYKEDYDKLTKQNDLNEIEPIENLEEDEI